MANKIFSGKGTNKIVGVDSNMVTDFLIGVLVTIIVYSLSRILGIFAVIGVPSLPQAINFGATGEFIIIVVAAAIFETVLFQEFILDFFDSKLKMPFIAAAILSSIAFMIYHLYTYQLKGIGVSGYIIVFIWGMIFCYLRKYTDSIMSVIGAHSTLNFIIQYIVGGIVKVV